MTIVPMSTRAHIFATTMRMNDIDISGIPDAEHYDELYRHPDAYLRRTLNRFRLLVDAGLASCKPSARDAAAVAKLLSPHRIPDRLTLSSIRVRQQAYRLLRNHVVAMWRSPEAGVPRRWFFVTLFDDLGNALEYAPVVEMARLKESFRKALAATGLYAMGFIEVQAGTNFPKAGAGRTLMFHAHAIGFTENDDFAAADVATHLNRELPLANWLGATTVQIDEIEQCGQLVRKCAYLFKGLVDGKRADVNSRTVTGLGFVAAICPPTLALRVFEALTYLEYDTATWSVGRGNELKTPWLQQLRVWHAQRTDRRLHSSDVEPAILWPRAWASAKIPVRREPFDFRWERAHAPTSAWPQAITPYLANRRRR